MDQHFYLNFANEYVYVSPIYYINNKVQINFAVSVVSKQLHAPKPRAWGPGISTISLNLTSLCSLWFMTTKEWIELLSEVLEYLLCQSGRKRINCAAAISPM